MNIAMFTNLYLPLVGGIQRSIATFKREFEERGHRVLVVTPEVKDQPLDDPTVVQVPAIQNFSGSDFSVAIPLPGYLSQTLDEFAPELVHSHHPFLLGDTAVRAATKRECPLVFTYHTMWEHYLHYAPDDSPAMQRFVKRMAAEYCNLCDHVIAPCESIAEILRERDITTPISAISTGIDTERFHDGDGDVARERAGVPHNAFVAGYIGRLGPEKNLTFVAEALVRFCRRRKDAHALIVGTGEAAADVEQVFAEADLGDRLHMPGVLQGSDLVDAYHALDAFVFASKSETQGLVLAEALAAGCPVVALDAPGARDVVEDGKNGRLLMDEDAEGFAKALRRFAEHTPSEYAELQKAALAAGGRLSRGNCAEQMLELYQQLVADHTSASRDSAWRAWSRTRERLAAEWQLWSGRAAAAAEAATPERPVSG